MANAVRERIVVANWKMYKNHEEAQSYLDALLPRIRDAAAKVYLAVPYTLIQLASELTAESTLVIGAQNMNDAREGAFTGEIAGRMLADAGAHFVILGHSERRRFFGETDEVINKKVLRALESNLQPLICVGESLEDHDAGKTKEVVERELNACLANVKPEQVANAIIAYEPIWAIGSGEPASPELAEEIQGFLRQCVAKVWGDDAASKVRILYGGSVMPENAGTLVQKPDVDGLLVGGASLSAEVFSQIVNAMPAPVESAEPSLGEST